MKQPSARAKAWIEAGKILARDPHAKVKCPNCDDDLLVVEDTPKVKGKWERILRCPGCKARNVMLLSDPPA